MKFVNYELSFALISVGVPDDKANDEASSVLPIYQQIEKDTPLLREDLKLTKDHLISKLENSKNKIIKWIAGMLVIQTVIYVILYKLFG